jgi:hypothetical protein
MVTIYYTNNHLMVGWISMSLTTTFSFIYLFILKWLLVITCCLMITRLLVITCCLMITSY